MALSLSSLKKRGRASVELKLRVFELVMKARRECVLPGLFKGIEVSNGTACQYLYLSLTLLQETVVYARVLKLLGGVLNGALCVVNRIEGYEVLSHTVRDDVLVLCLFDFTHSLYYEVHSLASCVQTFSRGFG